MKPTNTLSLVLTVILLYIKSWMSLGTIVQIIFFGLKINDFIKNNNYTEEI